MISYRQMNDFVHIIRLIIELSNFIDFHFTAHSTFMDDLHAFFACLDTNRSHQSLAVIQTITRHDVQVT